MEQWQSYNDAAGGSNRYNGNGNGQLNRDYSARPAQAQPPAGFKYEQQQQYSAAGAGGGLNSHPTPNSMTSPITTPQLRDGNGDVTMQDAHDPYAGKQYPMRPHHQSHLSGGAGRSSNLHSPQEPSAAAQRYSPMEVLSPTSPYAPKQNASGQFSAPPATRQSPTRPSDYQPPQSPYYQGGRQAPQQLPSLASYAAGNEGYTASATVSSLEASYANDPKSPRRPVPQSTGRGPVPEFKKLRAPTDLRPKVNAQPPFRRANPEGGFISVSSTNLNYRSKGRLTSFL